MSRAELSKLSGIPYSTIAEIENNEQKTSTKLHKIAAHLRARIEWLETGELPVEPVAGVREDPPRPAVTKLKIHDVYCSPDGALVGAEWDKIEGDEYRQLALDFIQGLVTAQKNAARRPGKVLPTRAKPLKSKDRRVSYD